MNRLAALDIPSNNINLPNKGRSIDSTVVGNVLHVVFGIAGAIALIVIIIAGLQYALSQGNPQSAAKAKDAIIYALVGLVVCVIGYGVVSFVVKGLGL